MQGRKPTRYEWPILERNNLDTRKWLIQKNGNDTMQLISKETGKIIVINKD